MLGRHARNNLINSGVHGGLQERNSVEKIDRVGWCDERVVVISGRSHRGIEEKHRPVKACRVSGENTGRKKKNTNHRAFKVGMRWVILAHVVENSLCTEIGPRCQIELESRQREHTSCHYKSTSSN
jgi:hypothetical protein